MNKFDDFIDLVEKRLIVPIENTDVKEYCTATLLLIFATIDSLSKITCSDEQYKLYKKNEGVGDRFKSFLSNRLGGLYEKNAGRIYQLRNSITHTGLSEKICLTKNNGHLESIDKCFVLNTNQFFDDIKNEIRRIKKEYKDTNSNIYKQSISRLSDFKLVELGGETEPSPAPDEEVFSKQ